jgi:tetratricopeptide (TPR) repeat protein
MTKKRTLNFGFKFLGVFFFIIFILSGCVTVDKGNKVEGAESTNEMQFSSELDEKMFSKKLPEMTADEYEILGDSLLSKGNLHLAFLQYERSLERNPANIRVEYKKGLTFLAGKKSDEAIEQFNIVLRKNPVHAAAYEGLGRAYFQKRYYLAAEQRFCKALELDPSLWKSRNFLGNIYDYRAKYEKAISEYKHASIKRCRLIIKRTRCIITWDWFLRIWDDILKPWNLLKRAAARRAHIIIWDVFTCLKA